VDGTDKSQEQYNVVNPTLKDSEIFEMGKCVAPSCVSRQLLKFNKNFFQTF
jgi:hypothetical protein